MFASDLLCRFRSHVCRYHALESCLLFMLTVVGQEPAQASKSEHTPALTASWLAESHLSGARLASGPNQPVQHADIEGFYGQVVAATIRHPQFRESRTLLHARDLIGMRWQVRRCPPGSPTTCRGTHLRIAHAVRARGPANWLRQSGHDDTWLFEVEFANTHSPTRRNWRNLCGTRGAAGMFVSGRWTNGQWSPRGYTFACPGSAVFRCASELGYSPWVRTTTSSQRVNLGPLHLACVHALRGDYCGNGTSHSFARRGNVIDVSDRFGFNRAGNSNQLVPEASFSRSGASWLDQHRTSQPGRASSSRPSCTLPGRQPAPASASTTLIEVKS